MAIHKNWSGTIPIQADCAYWPPDETFPTKARFMQAIIYGMVPTISMNLRDRSEKEKALLKAWLEFYARHQQTLALGKFTPLTQDAHNSLSTITSEKSALVCPFGQHCPGILEAKELTGKSIFLLNGTSGSHIHTLFRV